MYDVEGTRPAPEVRRYGRKMLCLVSNSPSIKILKFAKTAIYFCSFFFVHLE